MRVVRNIKWAARLYTARLPALNKCTTPTEKGKGSVCTHRCLVFGLNQKQSDVCNSSIQTSEQNSKLSRWCANDSASLSASWTRRRVPCCPTTTAATWEASRPMPFRSEAPRRMPYRIPEVYASPAPQVSTGKQGDGGMYIASPFTPM